MTNPTVEPQYLTPVRGMAYVARYTRENGVARRDDNVYVNVVDYDALRVRAENAESGIANAERLPDADADYIARIRDLESQLTQARAAVERVREVVRSAPTRGHCLIDDDGNTVDAAVDLPPVFSEDVNHSENSLTTMQEWQKGVQYATTLTELIVRPTLAPEAPAHE